MTSTFIEYHKLPESFSDTIEQFYNPLADKIAQNYITKKEVYFVGINGCQGSGKSTLTDYIAHYLTETHKLNVVVMSLDDFYLPREVRSKLSVDVHPLLDTRGVPGTHDTQSLKHIIESLKAKKTDFLLPRFNKATDNPCPKEKWTLVEKPIDIVLIEGWCWGVKHQSDEELESSVNELEEHHDNDGVWRNYVNQQLKDNYEPLYGDMDFWLVLQSPSFDCVYKWRLEQEQKLQNRNKGLENSHIMSEDEILNFTQYFQRLSVHSCKTISHSADLTFYLDYDRSITRVSSGDEK